MGEKSKLYYYVINTCRLAVKTPKLSEWKGKSSVLQAVVQGCCLKKKVNVAGLKSLIYSACYISG